MKNAKNVHYNLDYYKEEITFTLNEIVKQINKEIRDMPRDRKKEYPLNIKYKLKGILIKLKGGSNE